ncbi:MAG: 4-hydroxy-3-methylbut-2-enyl diphosphate reductase [Hyphomicrobiales bacterium]|nr:MAG: 4-hydroxy-3-methylbut-2-enyl diphosphate reductase [Hyphomicrobiales bacterium]
MTPAAKAPLTLYLAAPRGFCAGVDRAIKIVELALKVHGAPVYVRHEIVHNKYVVDDLRKKGAVFVDELEEIPPTDQPVIFSAHGVPKSVPRDAQKRNMFFIDATCPLVSKVHKEAMIHERRNRDILLIGHKGHPEVIGTMGQLPDGAVTLIETVEDAENLVPKDAENLAWITQTTLSVDDTRDIVAALQNRFPNIVGPHKDDICYATTNRQASVKAIAAKCDAVLVVGAPNSSNSQRLREVAERSGAKIAQLVQRATDIDWQTLGLLKTVGLTAGASAPEILVDEVIEAFKSRYEVSVELENTVEEDVVFTLPRALRESAAELDVTG